MTVTLSAWRKAKHCDSGSCIEVAVSKIDGAVVIRSASGLLTATAEEWKAFYRGVGEGDFRDTLS